jgi:hypothetical protein
LPLLSDAKLSLILKANNKANCPYKLNANLNRGYATAKLFKYSKRHMLNPHKQATGQSKTGHSKWHGLLLSLDAC